MENLPRVLLDKVLIKRNKDNSKTESGLVFASEDKREKSSGIVMKVGSDPNISFSEGEEVVFDTYSTTTITLNGEEYVVIPYTSVWLVTKDFGNEATMKIEKYLHSLKEGITLNPKDTNAQEKIQELLNLIK